MAEYYEFSMRIPLPDSPVEKGRALVRCGTLAEDPAEREQREGLLVVYRRALGLL